MQHTLQFSDSQEKDLFLQRRAYLQQQASLLHELQDLEVQFKDRNSSIARCTDDASAGECARLQDSYQISECRNQLQEAYIVYKGIIYDGVSVYVVLEGCCMCVHNWRKSTSLVKFACSSTR